MPNQEIIAATNKRYLSNFSDISSFVVYCPESKTQICSIVLKDKGSDFDCYISIFGQPMVCGTAKGYGWDKSTAADVAVKEAIKILSTSHVYPLYATTKATKLKEISKTFCESFSWDFYLDKAGLKVLQAI